MIASHGKVRLAVLVILDTIDGIPSAQAGPLQLQHADHARRSEEAESTISVDQLPSTKANRQGDSPLLCMLSPDRFY